jgi:AcrR family transcriptional regulator
MPAAIVTPRERILNTALRLFYSDGIAATGVDRIIAEAGVAKATLYYHYPSKETLAVAFLAERHRQWMAKFRQHLAAQARQDLPAVADALACWMREPDFRGCAFINAITEDATPAVRAQALIHKAELQQIIAALCQKQVGGARAVTLARQAMLVIEGMIIRYQMTADPQIMADSRAVLAQLAQTKPARRTTGPSPSRPNR